MPPPPEPRPETGESAPEFSRPSSGHGPRPISAIHGQTTVRRGTRESNFWITESTVRPSAPLSMLQNPAFLRAVVKLPQSTDRNHWLSTHTIDFFRNVSFLSFYLSKTHLCTQQSCGLMNAGTSEYLWREPQQSPTRVSANEYMDRLLQDIEKKVNDESLFPTSGMSYPEDFETSVRDVFRHLFRVFTHAYSAHYGGLQHLRIDASFNTVFIHFMYFAAEFNLIGVVELEPAKELLRTICGPIVLHMAQTQAPNSAEDSAFVQRQLSDTEDKLTKLQARIDANQDSELHRTLILRKRMLEATVRGIRLPEVLVGYFGEHTADASIPSTPSADSINPRGVYSEVAAASKEVTAFYARLVHEPRLFIEKHSQYRRKKTTLNDFHLLAAIGKGGFGNVRLCQYKGDTTGQVYVIKAVNKLHLISKGHAGHVREERNVMVESSRRSQWLVKLNETFQDRDNLYFIMEFGQGGDMMRWLIEKDIFDETVARFYIAELLLAVEELHSFGFAHRDLKPDNLVIGVDGHLKITDFGFAKRNTREMPISEAVGSIATVSAEHGQSNMSHSHTVTSSQVPGRGRFFSTVGSPTYIAPEVLLQRGHDESVDWWAVGIMLYEMVYGFPPFSGDELENTNQKITRHKDRLRFPTDRVVSEDCKDLIRRLVCDQHERLGIDAIKTHPFFRGLDWATLRQSPAPFQSEIRVTGPTDTRYFDTLHDLTDGTVVPLASQAASSWDVRSAHFLCFSASGSGISGSRVASAIGHQQHSSETDTELSAAL
jgi:serine/threonine protein kinase